MSVAKILAVDDEPDFELLITQRFRRQIREKEFEFRFAHHGASGDAKCLAALPHLCDRGAQELRGRTGRVKIWTWDAAS